MEGRCTGLVIGILLMLGAVSHSSGSEESVGSLVDVISLRDQARLEQVLVQAEPYNSLEKAYLVIKGISGLGFTTENNKLASNACNYVLANPTKTVEDIFFSTSVGAIFHTTCKVSATRELRSQVEQAAKETTDTKTLYHAITAAMNMKMYDEVDKEALVAALMQAVEKEDTPQSYAYAFLAASVIPDVDLSALFDSIEDIIAQADETPSTLYFEGGLGVTADVVEGIFALADRVGSKPAITEAQATKFGNFLVTSKYTASLSDAVHLATAARTLSSNKYVVPTALVPTNSQPISSSNPDLALRLTTLMEGVVDGVTLKVKSLEDPEGEVNPRTRTMTAGADKITFSYPMFKDTSGPGQYTVIISTESESPSSAVMLSAAEVSVIVSFQVAVGSAQLSIVDKDQGVTTKSISLEYPNTSKASSQADQHSKVIMVFTLNNVKDSEPVVVHQAFVRLSLGAQEIFFVATPNAGKQYSFELDVAESAKDFGKLSGTYSLSLMVGDFALENPFTWDVASVELKFPGTAQPKEESMAYKSKPLIEHLFRVPEKRPPKILSTAFTVLVFVPLAILLVAWLIMGVNFSNISSGGIWGVLFHAGLGGILCLYYCFWAQLNMFTTLKYLVAIGGFTFLTGNRMLRNIAKARQS